MRKPWMVIWLALVVFIVAPACTVWRRSLIKGSSAPALSPSLTMETINVPCGDQRSSSEDNCTNMLSPPSTMMIRNTVMAAIYPSLIKVPYGPSNISGRTG